MLTAKNVMNAAFGVLRPDQTVSEAMKNFDEAGKQAGRRIFGMMVVDDGGKLMGMLSMYDILLFIRPKHTHIWGMMDDIEVEGLIDHAAQRLKSIRVEDIMSTEVVSVGPETHFMAILDVMIRRHVRRLPVVRDDKILGIIYLSDIFRLFGEKLSR
jgi:CBS domain-containing protein